MQAKSRTSRVPYSRDIYWFVNAAAAALGERSSMVGTQSVLEHGGPFTGVPETDLYNDWQVGWCAGEGGVEKARRLGAVWGRVDRRNQCVLYAYYARTWLLAQPQGSTIESRVGERVAGVAMVVLDNDERSQLLGACGSTSGSRVHPVFANARRVALASAQEAHRQWARVEAELREDAA